jgi:hypothetical protein
MTRIRMITTSSPISPMRVLRSTGTASSGVFRWSVAEVALHAGNADEAHVALRVTDGGGGGEVS